MQTPPASCFVLLGLCIAAGVLGNAWAATQGPSVNSWPWESPTEGEPHNPWETSTLGEPQNACESYTELSEWQRSVAYENDDYEHVHLCDRELEEGWYRAVSKAGGDMPTSAPGLNKCGSLYPIWLDGTLPAAEGEMSTSDACIMGPLSDCAVTINVKIKNCGEFNVYYLKPSNACPEAYCFGIERKCPPGFKSPTGFTPGCTGVSPPELTGSPKLWYEPKPIDGPTDGTYYELHFLCDFDDNTTEDILFDVTFYIGTQKVYNLTNLRKQDLPASLPESEFSKFQDKTDHTPNLGFGNNLKCRVQGKWSESDDPGRGVDVSEYYGFEIVSPQPIELEEDDEVEILIRSRLPFVCPSVDPDCHIKIVLHAPAYQTNFKKCPVDSQKKFLVLGKSGCETQLPGSEWNETHVIPVKAAVDPLVAKGSRTMIAKLYSDTNTWRPALSNLALSPVTITIKDVASKTAGMRCYAIVDPHMALFHGLRWEGQFFTGEFILYRNIHTDSEVQVRLGKCNRAATCVCSTMVRAGKSLFILDTCGERGSATSVKPSHPPRAKLYDCDEGRSEMVLEKRENQYKFTFPSGSVVTVNFIIYKNGGYFHNVYVTPSAADFKKSYGLCGHIDAARHSVLALRDGSIASTTRAFMKNWKVSSDERLWQGKSTAPTDPVYYCGCDEDTISCEATQEHMDCVDKWFHDKEYSICQRNKRRKRALLEGGPVARSTDIVDEDTELDWVDDDVIEEEFDWQNGWDEVSARTFCEDYILGRSSVQACDAVPSIDVEQQDAIDTCVLDIKILGDTGASSAHVESVKQQCVTVASRNVSLWASSDNGTMTPPSDIIDASCLNECYDRGSCVEGVCECDAGFSGADCGRNDSAVPSLYRLPYSGVCDLQHWTCHATLVYGEDLFESDDLACQVQYFLVSAAGVEDVTTVVTDSELERPSAAACNLNTPLLSTPQVLGHGFGIRMSNDGEHFSNRLIMLAFDSKCANCTNDHYENVTCEEKDAICRVGGECYDDKEASPENSCLTCDVQTSTTQWTTKDDTCFISSTCYGQEESKSGQSCLRCDPQTSDTAWTQRSGTCLIDGVCRSRGAKNPSSVCESCQPDVSAISWTHIEGCGGAAGPGPVDGAVCIGPALPLLLLLSAVLAMA